MNRNFIGKQQCDKELHGLEKVSYSCVESQRTWSIASIDLLRKHLQSFRHHAVPRMRGAG